jgi:Phage integrase, N-terminal SAM-like domain
VKELCTRYLADLQAGLILGKGGRPKKASTIVTDTGRIERHIIPLIGTRRVKDLTKTDINKVLKDIMAGKTRVSVKTKKLRGKAIAEAALELPRVPLVFSAAFLPTPSRQGSSRGATRPMASASQRTMYSSADYPRRSIEYWVECSATP